MKARRTSIKSFCSALGMGAFLFCQHAVAVLNYTSLNYSSELAKAGDAYCGLGRPSAISSGAALLRRESFAQLPLRFESCGETPMTFIARTNDYCLRLRATEAELVLQANPGVGRLGCGADLGSPRNARSLHANKQLPGPRRDRAAPRREPTTTLSMRLVGADRRARVHGEDELLGRSSYFIGSESNRWRRNITNYGRVKVSQIYHGIDLICYGSSGQLEY